MKNNTGNSSPGKKNKIGAMTIGFEKQIRIPTNHRLNLECIICQSFIQLEWREWQDALNYLQKAEKVSTINDFNSLTDC